MLDGVDRILLRVGSVEGATTYYRDVLGMKLLRAERGIAAFELAGGIELVLHDSPDLPSQGVYFRTQSVDAIYDQREKLKLKFTSSPRTVSKGKAATVKDPFGNVLLLLDRTKEAGAEHVIESAAPADGALFPGVELRHQPQRDKLIAAYERVGRTADDLPYTHHFEALYAEYSAAFDAPPPTREETWRHLLNIRKGKLLPKLGEARSVAPELADGEKLILRGLLETLAGGTGRRDRLPYTTAFDAVVDTFNRDTGKKLTPHQLWRAVATLAK